MPLAATIIQQIEKSPYSLDLSNQKLTDTDIEELLPYLARFPNIKQLDLRYNSISSRGAELLAGNSTIRHLRLKEGNSLTIKDLQPFLQNYTITDFSIVGGSGELLTQFRQHIASNKSRGGTPPQATATSAEQNKNVIPTQNQAAPAIAASTSVVSTTQTSSITYLPEKKSGYLFLDDIPAGAYVIGNQPLKSSGDIYHILAYVTFAHALGYKIPSVVLAFDNFDTQKQSQRAFGLAQALGFEKNFIQASIPTSSRPNARLTSLRRSIAEQKMPFYLIDQKMTTALFAFIVQYYGFTEATKFFRNNFLNLTQYARHSFSAQMNAIDSWVDAEFKRIQLAADGKKILLFNNRVGEGANKDQDLGKQALNQIEEILKPENIFHWYLIADATTNSDPKSNKTHLFSGGESTWDVSGLYKLRHMLLLIKLQQLPNLIGIAGNTSGTLDIAAFLGYKVYCFHTFTETRGNLYLDAQDYRMVIQHAFMSVGLPISRTYSGSTDHNGQSFLSWLQNTLQNKMAPLPERVIGITSCKTDIKYAAHQDRLPFSGALTWPVPNDSRNLAPLPQLTIETAPKFHASSMFKSMDTQLRAAIAPPPLPVRQVSAPAVGKK
jgi:hypothetical protein